MNGTKIKIKQTKVSIDEVSSITSDIHGLDPLTDELGVAIMCCGHKIGRDSMTALIRSIISSNRY